MSSSLRARSLLATGTLALLAAGLPVALVPASATATGPALVYTADVDQDGLFGIYSATALDPATRHAVLADNDNLDVERAILSPDGTRIAALVDTTINSDTDNGYALQVMNLDGSHRQTVVPAKVTEAGTASNPTFTVDGVTGFDWTPDSNTLVYGAIHGVFSSTSGSPTLTLRHVPAAGGTSVAYTGGTALADPAVAADGSIAAVKVATNGEGSLVVFDPATATTGAAIANDVQEPAWSPDGSSLAFVRDTSGASNDTSDIEVVTRDSSGTWSTPAVAVSTSGNWYDQDVTWASDSTVWFTRFDDTSNVTPPQDLWSTTFDATSGWSAPTQETNTPSLDEASATFGPADTTGPAAATFKPAKLGGTTTTLQWTNPTDPDFSHVVLTRSGTTIYSGPASSFADTHTVVGATYTYSITAYDGAGNAESAPAATRVVTALNPPKIVVANPTSKTQKGLAFPVSWGNGNPAGTTYTAQWATKGGTTWVIGSPHTFANGTATRGTITGAAGQTYYLRAIVSDGHGNSATTGYSMTNVPLDQSVGKLSAGWTKVSASNAWLGTLVTTKKAGASFSVSVTSRTIGIVASKCAGCGSFKVYVSGKLVATVSTTASSSLVRQLVWSKTYTSIAKRPVTIVASGGKAVVLDGVLDTR